MTQSRSKVVMSEDEKKAHRNGYSKGYQAGRKRTEKEDAKWMRVHSEIHDTSMRERKQRRDQFFCAALSGLLSYQGANWKMGHVQVNNVDTYTTLAIKFADKAMEKLK